MEIDMTIRTYLPLGDTNSRLDTCKTLMLAELVESVELHKFNKANFTNTYILHTRSFVGNEIIYVCTHMYILKHIFSDDY